jgi:hypothetical protein
VIDLFGTVDAEQEWVLKAGERLDELRARPDNQRWASVRLALEHARRLRDEARELAGAKKQEKLAAANRIWKAIEDRYAADLSAQAVEIMKEMRRDRSH